MITITKNELLEIIRKLQEQVDLIDNTMSEESATTTDVHNSNENPENKETMSENNNNDSEMRENIVEEPTQTNGKIVDNIVAGHNTKFEENTMATECLGVEELLSANFDQRFATILTQYTELKIEVDKIKVALAEILTRIELVQEVTDKVTTVDHDTLLSESIKLLI